MKFSKRTTRDINKPPKSKSFNFNPLQWDNFLLINEYLLSFCLLINSPIQPKRFTTDGLGGELKENLIVYRMLPKACEFNDR